MIFTARPLSGAFLIEPEIYVDERGFFARSFCVNEFVVHKLSATILQCNISYNRYRGTLRGLHYQVLPHQEAKLVRCTAGAAFDVMVDIRTGSPTFKQWLGVELSAENHKMLYIPEGFAHGFQTLADHTELFYQMSMAYVPEAGRGIRWDDPELAIAWPPVPERVISQRDLVLPTCAELGSGLGS